MSDSRTYLELAQKQYELASAILQMSDGDEVYVNNAGYHAQQAVELALKHDLELNGIRYPRSHEIEGLIRLARENGLGDTIPDYFYDHAEMITSWEAKTRYVKNYSLEREKLEATLEALPTLLYSVAKSTESRD